MKIHHIINIEELPYPIARNLTSGLPLIKKMLAILLKFVKKNYSESERIVFFCRGSSGAIIAGLGADYFMSKGYEVFISHIKKKGESSHNGAITIYGADLDGAVKIIIDDFVATGDTIKAIVEKTIAVFGTRGKEVKFDILCVSGILEKPNEMTVDFDKLPIDNALCL